MAYVVSLTSRAERDLAQLYDDINAGQSGAALKSYLGLRREILSLEEHPNRCPVTPESPELRHPVYGRKPHLYRVIYRVWEKKKQVEILHIRHGKQQRSGR